jgi:hypothetical protein
MERFWHIKKQINTLIHYALNTINTIQKKQDSKVEVVNEQPSLLLITSVPIGLLNFLRGLFSIHFCWSQA